MESKHLETMEAVLPVGLVALLVNRLMKDITKDAPDIVTTYYDYMLRLVGPLFRDIVQFYC